ncbi:hypothetical protein HZF05_11185 [Sphingomonas sp. CGMCC 1.13654]|uniref:Uncharacterized protein n=1 Tax=Sphingomonas chungangi TaxID=2683589 RepID=A0A838LAZ0_9SPHN|nr:hypothetical protein [Sphingomonas chungangi]MBA2934658.1 hypothetical protein [Sphingomonas chungangi]MVW57693.1 hypothetical protein [Sphingomonas chungangi]
MDEGPPAALSPVRAVLASFDHAYAVAIQQRRAGDSCRLVVGTGNPLQPFRVTHLAPRPHERILALIA